MLTLFITLGAVLENAGFSSALIQRKGGSDEERTAVFYFSLIVSALYTVVFFLCAPLMAKFFNVPELTFIARVYSTTFVFSATCSVYETVLRAELEFKKIMICRVVSGVISSCLGVSLALNGFGVWSLVYMAISASIFSAAGLFFSSSWRPAKRLDFRPLKKLFGFGSKVFLTTVLDQCASKMNTIIIGRFYTPALLGFYSRSVRLQALVASNLLFSLGPIMFSGFAHIQDDPERFKASFVRSLRLLSAINIPLFVGMAIIARPLILLVYGSQWEPSVVYFQILCVGSIFIPIALVNRAALMAKGCSGKILKITVIYRILTIIALFSVARYGVITLAMVFGLSSWGFAFFQGWSGRRITDVSFFRQIGMLLPFVGTTGIMAMVLFAMQQIEMGNVLRVVSSILVGSVVYLSFIWFFCKDLFQEGCLLLAKLLGR